MKFTKKILDNGLTILHEKRDVDVTTVMVASKYGFLYEREEEKGIAHFLEHLCFKGTKKRKTRDISKEVEKLGGILNAFTSEEATAYYVTLPSKHFETAMDVMFDVYFNPIFPEEEVSKEAKVICEEIKMYRDNPRRHVYDKIKEALYEAPFGITGTGKPEFILNVKRDLIKEKHKKYYHPKNSVLVVVGNNSFEEVLEMAKKLTPNKEGEMPNIPKIELKNSDESEIRKELQQVNLILGVHFPFKNASERHAVEVFSTILGSGMSSKLFLEVREKRGLVYGVRTDLDIGKNYGYLVISAGTEKGKEEEVIKICKEEFSKMKNISDKELEEGKIQIIGNRKVESEGSNETAVELLMEEISKDARDYYKYEEKINNVKKEDIEKLSNLSEFSSFILGP